MYPPDVLRSFLHWFLDFRAVLHDRGAEGKPGRGMNAQVRGGDKLPNFGTDSGMAPLPALREDIYRC